MEVVPEIVDFRLTGNFMTRCFIVNNKNSVRLDIVVPAASGPFVLHPVAACETEVTWTTEPQPGTGLQCIRAQIPPKHMMQVILRTMPPTLSVLALSVSCSGLHGCSSEWMPT